jgi:Dyp-type peroxidase family
MSQEFLASVINEFKSRQEFKLTADEYFLLNLPPIDVDSALSEKNKSPYYGRILADLQGNILKDHGRNHAVHLFLIFKNHNPAQVRKEIETFARHLTTAEDHHRIALTYKEAKRKYRLNKNAETKKALDKAQGTHFIGFYLSKKGYEALGFDERHIPDDPSFRAAMKSPQTKNALFDSYEDWESKYDEVHAMILIANSDPSLLDAAHTQNYLGELSNHHAFTEQGDVVTERAYVKALKERGVAIDGRKKTDEPVEHFGYRDGISQPLFYAIDVREALRDDLHKKGFRHFDPAAPLALALAKDQNGLVRDPKGVHLSYGSYFVFRKYRQDVDAFEEVVKELAGSLRTRIMNEASRRDLAKAFIVGRFPDGTPVATQESQGRTCSRPNDFLFDNSASRCPLRAHILRTGQRGSGTLTGINDFANDHLHRIIRRGITYQEKEEKGLLFMCFQRSLSQQFEFIQSRWANWGPQPDRLIGLAKATQQGVWPRSWGDPSYDFRSPQSGIPISNHLRSMISLRGGEYFFAPSKSFLMKISSL